MAHKINFDLYTDEDLSKLPSRNRQVWEMSKSGMNTAEISRSLGISPATIYSYNSHSRMIMDGSHADPGKYPPIPFDLYTDEDLSKLTPRKRRIWLMRKNGIRTKEIARILGIAECSVFMNNNISKKIMDGKLDCPKFYMEPGLWKLKSPDGNIYVTKNLKKFVREHLDLFDFPVIVDSFVSNMSQIRKIVNGTPCHIRKSPFYHGWTPVPDEDE